MTPKSFTVTISIYSESRLSFVIETIKRFHEEVKNNKNLLTSFEGVIIILDPILKKKFQKFQKIIPYQEILKIRIIVAKKAGLSYARNVAIHNCESNYLVFLDDDAVPSNNYLSAIFNTINNSSYSIIAGKIIPIIIKNKNKKILPSDLYWIWGCTYEPTYTNNKKFVRNPIGANMIFNNELLRKIGGFSNFLGRYKNNLLSAEETLTSYLLTLKFGQLTFYQPNIIAYHFVPLSRLKLSYILKRAYFEGKSKKKINILMKKIIKKTSKRGVLQTEYNYLIYLFKKEFFSKENINFKIYRVLVIFFTLLGYLT